MEALPRKEYPAMLASLQPAQAVSIINERVKRIARVNIEIADWLLERRRVEEAYVIGLKKLAHKQPPDSQSELGVFTTPWQKIVTATDSIASSHQNFATSIDRDVELPLRTFASRNREMQAMVTMQGNLNAMAKELEEAQQRADKLGKKGGKANSLKVDNATQKLDTANSQWDAQAPLVFEKLQAVDESRLNHLRVALTQFQTHEADRVERDRQTAETTLNSLLEVITANEIQNFVRNTTQGKPKLERNARRTSSSAGSSSVPQPAPRAAADDDASEHSGRHDGASEPKSGLKRFGTMLGRRRQSVHGSFVRAPSPSKGFGPFGRAPGSRDGRPSPSPRTSSTNLRENPARDNRLSSLVESPTSQANAATASSSNRRMSRDATNGEFTGFKAGSLLNPDIIPPRPTPSENVNGTTSKDNVDVSDVPPPPGPPPSHQKEYLGSSIERDSEGFTVPKPANDPISQAQQEAAAAANEGEQPQFKLDIKNEPIREEDADAQAALSNVANTLRSTNLATPSRKMGTVRGRRDVRNTIYVPGPEVSESHLPPSPGQPLGSGKAPVVAALSTEHSQSDTQSIRSARSLTGSMVIKHPDMHEPGLNASIVETVSACFENGEIKTGTVIGEVALAYGHADASSTSLSGTETIRLTNFPALEAIAPNHGFVHELSPEKPGEYTLNLPLLHKTTVAFRYKVHVDDTNLAAQVPFILKPAWKPQGEKLGIIIEYALNPSFSSTPLTINNLVLIATYDSARAAGCQTKPAGTHLKEKSLIYWRLGDVKLDCTFQKVVGRLVGAESGEPKPGIVEARWEITVGAGQAFGSGLAVARLDMMPETKGKEREKESSNPFADDSVASPMAVTAQPLPSPQGGNWIDVRSTRRLISGKYDAKQVEAGGSGDAVAVGLASP